MLCCVTIALILRARRYLSKKCALLYQVWRPGMKGRANVTVTSRLALTAVTGTRCATNRFGDEFILTKAAELVELVRSGNVKQYSRHLVKKMRREIWVCLLVIAKTLLMQKLLSSSFSYLHGNYKSIYDAASLHHYWETLWLTVRLRCTTFASWLTLIVGREIVTGILEWSNWFAKHLTWESHA